MLLEKMLKELSYIDIVGSFIDPFEAVKQAEELQPDLVFLDIQMPGLSGLRAAELIMESCPNVDIVFVTAYDEYAVQAFELNALDYVLKPLQRDRLARTISRFVPRQQGQEIQEQPESAAPMLIRCFQMLQIEQPGHVPEVIKWRTAKAQELFAYLLHHRGQLVRKGVLIELLWPDFDEKKASTHLYTTVYQIRQCLKRMVVDITIHNMSSEEGYVLDAKKVRVDVVEWEQDLSKLPPISLHTMQEHQRMVDAYRGDYLGEYDYLWVEHERQRLRLLWLQLAQQLAEWYVTAQMLTEAFLIYNRLLQHNPYHEDSYFVLMKLYDQNKDRAGVEEQYRRMTELLQRDLDVSPHKSIVEWYDQWKQGLT